MGESAGNKRKASEALGGTVSTAEIDAALKEPPRALALTMLAWLPPDATLGNSKAKNISEAIDMVKMELRGRKLYMARKLKFDATSVRLLGCGRHRFRPYKATVEPATASTFEIDVVLQQSRLLASSLLACLPPEDATRDNKDAKQLLKTFRLVKDELRRRTDRMVKGIEETGASKNIVISGVLVPIDVFLIAFDFLPRHETVHKVSLVSKTWLSVARAPQLWHTLDTVNGLLCMSRNVYTMTQLLNLLNRPQFALLKSLSLPNTVRVSKNFIEKLAKACPMLEDIDLGFRLNSTAKPDSTCLFSLPSLFPQLSKIGLNLKKVTAPALEWFCERIGDRLLSLEFKYEYTSIGDFPWQVSDKTFRVISRHCTKLKRFGFSCNWRRVQGALFRLSSKGVISLLKGCPALKSLTLIDAGFIGLSAFEYIAEDESTKLNHLLVVGHSELMNNTSLCARLAKKIEHFEAITALNT